LTDVLRHSQLDWESITILYQYFRFEAIVNQTPSHIPGNGIQVIL
jgi:hypothetical protein